jgi:group I intron endonuclease
MIIYCITNNINSKKYVGQTKVGVEERFKKHVEGRSRCSAIEKAVQKYGKDNFSIEQLAKANTAKELDLLEMKFIKEMDTISPNGYNLNEGGNCPTFSLETRKKLSEALKGNTNSKGKIRTQETKEKMSKAHKGKKLSVEHKKKLAKAKLGKKLSEEHRKNIGLGNTGRQHSEETRQKIRKKKLNKNSKVDKKEIPLIKEMVGNGKTQKEIAEIYGVCRQTISYILRKRAEADENGVIRHKE